MKFLTLSLLVALVGCASTPDDTKRSVAKAHPDQIALGESNRPCISKAGAIGIARAYAEKKYPYVDFPNKLATAIPSQAQNDWLVHLGGLPKKDAHRGPNIRICGSYATTIVVCPDGTISKSSSYSTLAGW